jgi:mRNA-degrading endonuclease RelE of RelBE toxin-antitoxin system
MLEKTIEISGKPVTFRSSAAIPRIYRIKFKRDIFKDLTKLEKSYRNKAKSSEDLEIDDLEIFENVAYIMAYHADPTIPKTIDEWLDQFEMFSIYQVLPEILELWGSNLITDVQAKKDLAEVSGK